MFLCYSVDRNRKKANIKHNQLLMYSGKAYINRDGVAMEGRQMRPNCAPLCRKDCSQSISDEQRQRIFDRYYGLANLQRQWIFIRSLVDRTKSKGRSLYDPPKFKRNAAPKVRQRPRSANNTYYLEVDGGERIKVCQKLFLATFDFNIGAVTSALIKTNAAGELIDHDRRGNKSGQLNKKYA